MTLPLKNHWKHIGGLPVAERKNVTFVPRTTFVLNNKSLVMTGGESNGTFAKRFSVHLPLAPLGLLKVPPILSVALVSVPDTVVPPTDTTVKLLLASNCPSPT